MNIHPYPCGIVLGSFPSVDILHDEPKQLFEPDLKLGNKGLGLHVEIRILQIERNVSGVPHGVRGFIQRPPLMVNILP